VTITTLGYRGTGLSFDGAAVCVRGSHVTGMRTDAVIANAAGAADPTTDKTATTFQGIRPRRPEPA
jgi:hypothetical protein